MKQARFVAAARREFLAEVDYYSGIEPGLGNRFAAAVEEVAANTRRIPIKIFPFSLVYRPEDGGIVVFAVAHHARRPGYWRARTHCRSAPPR